MWFEAFHEGSNLGAPFLRSYHREVLVEVEDLLGLGNGDVRVIVAEEQQGGAAYALCIVDRIMAELLISSLPKTSVPRASKASVWVRSKEEAREASKKQLRRAAGGW